MKPNEQTPSVQPTSMTGSDWQRQALTGARAAAAEARKSDVASPNAEVARQRAAAQQVPDMLAAAEGAPAQPVQPQQTQPSQAAPTGEATGKPVVSGALAEDSPATGAAVTGTGGTSTGKKVAIALTTLLLLLGAAAAAYYFFLR